MNKRIGILAGLGLVVVLAAAGAFAAIRHGTAATANLIVVSDSACAKTWTAPISGRTLFTVENTSPSTVIGVQLQDAGTGAVYGQVGAVAPATEATLEAVLPPGVYSFRCGGGDGYALISPVEKVAGPPIADAHPLTPVPDARLQTAIAHYRKSVTPLIARLESDTDLLTTAVRAGRLPEARMLWLPAHLDYARLGAAYGTFGDLNDEIDGRPLGLVRGVHDPHFQGFLRLEYGLWHGQSAKELTPVATALDRAVHSLQRQFPSMTIPQGDLALRTHEILENALQFELTGETDEGSHTNLATAWANVQGTDLTLAALRPVLKVSDPRLLASLTSGLQHVAKTLAGYQRPGDRWVALQSLTTAQREQLDSSVSGLLENLELVPGKLVPVSASGGGDD